MGYLVIFRTCLETPGICTQMEKGLNYSSFKLIISVFRCTPVLVQAISEANRKQWMEAMDGKEPVSFTLSHLFEDPYIGF